MPFFAMPYRVLFHDTMAYGSHHYLSNFKFQNMARETALFESKVNGHSVWEEQLKDLVLLTREAYSLNLAPVMLGQKVSILLTYEDPTRSTVRLCFRVIRQDGQPVSCGYQTMICMHKDTMELVPAPSMITQYLDATNKLSLLEPLANPSFADRLKKGTSAVKDVFPHEVIQLGKRLANAEEKESYPRIVYDTPVQVLAASRAEIPLLEGGTAFTFPGQGSYSQATLREMYEDFPETVGHFRQADEVVRAMLGQEFMGVILATSREAHDRLLVASPDVTQIGIYLTGVLIAKILTERGLCPDLLVGHSVGELAALATAGVYSIESGLELVCKRILALRAGGGAGQMAAIACGAERVAQVLNDLKAHSLEIAVINHPKQTVVSGKLEDLELAAKCFASSGVSMTRIESPFPFHSSHLVAAVEPFREALSAISFAAARTPVYLCTESTILPTSGANLPEILSRQFVRRLRLYRIRVGDSPDGRGPIRRMRCRRHRDQAGY